jgi:hypothetical protein
MCKPDAGSGEQLPPSAATVYFTGPPQEDLSQLIRQLIGFTEAGSHQTRNLIIFAEIVAA